MLPMLRDKILRLSKTLTALQIAAKLGCNPATVWRHLKGRRKRGRRTDAPLARRARVLAMVQKHGAAEAARRLGVKRQSIYLRVKEWLAEAKAP